MQPSKLATHSGSSERSINNLCQMQQIKELCYKVIQDKTKESYREYLRNKLAKVNRILYDKGLDKTIRIKAIEGHNVEEIARW